jgi:hypothetical protein
LLLAPNEEEEKMKMRCRTTIFVRRGGPCCLLWTRWLVAWEPESKALRVRRPRNFSRVIGGTRRMGASTKKKQQQHERRTFALVGRGVRVLGYVGNEDKRPPGQREPPLCMFSGRVPLAAKEPSRSPVASLPLVELIVCRAFPFRGSFGKALEGGSGRVV